MDTIIMCFRNDFDRFWDLMEKQIDVCPDDLWTQKVGGYIYWQQIFHSILCVEFFSICQADSEPVLQKKYPLDVAMLKTVPDMVISKQEMHDLAKQAKAIAHNFMEKLTVENLTEPQVQMSNRMKREQTMQNALIALIRHCTYHLGCCDAVLRQHGLEGVY